MSPENVALSFYSDSVLMPLDAVKTSTSLPASICFRAIEKQISTVENFSSLLEAKQRLACYVPTYPQLFGGQLIITKGGNSNLNRNLKTRF